VLALPQSGFNFGQVIERDETPAADDRADLVTQPALIEKVAYVSGPDAETTGNLRDTETGHSLLLLR
jgi:hypothetical protein